MPVYLDFPDIEMIDPKRKSYMFAVVTGSEPSDEYKDYTLERLDLDKEQCIFVSIKEHENWIKILEEELKLVNPQMAIFAHCEIPDLNGAPIPFVKIDDEIDDDTYKKIERMALSDFPHLHLHDEYSLRDGLSTAQQRTELMMERGWTYLTATNHGSLGGWVKQHVLSKKLGMKPIYGVEAYTNKYRNLPKENFKDMTDEMKTNYRKNNHQILLARTVEGWFNIIQIQNDAELNGFYYSPRTDADYLMKHGKGIIGTSTDGGAGEIPQILCDESLSWENRLIKAKEKYDYYKEAFDDYYIELNLIDWDKQIDINRKLISFGQWVSAKYVITTDVHYLRQEDSKVHDILLMLRDSKTMVDKAFALAAKFMKPKLEALGLSTNSKTNEWKEENEREDKKEIIKESLAHGRSFLEENNYKECIRIFDENIDKVSKGEGSLDKSLKEDAVWEFEGKDFYFKTLDDLYETWERMHGHEDDTFTEDVFWKAIRDTRSLVRSIEHFEIDTSIKLPKISDDSNGTLEKLCRKGMNRFGLADKTEYEARLSHELSVIKKLDFADYFLIFRKIINFCKENKIYYGPGRGSASGSLISYCLEITKLDPITHGLLFERFLDEERSDPPDIDFDVDPRYRQKVKDGMVSLFGENHVCSVGSYQLIWTKTALKDVGRVFCVDPIFLNQITKGLAVKYVDENDDDSEGDALDKLEWDSLLERDPTLRGLMNSHPYMNDACKLLRGQIRNIGKHPAGMIVSSVDLPSWIPLRIIGRDTDPEIVACWTEGLALKELQEIGLVKYDILGLRTISIISDSLGLIEQTTKIIEFCDGRRFRLRGDEIVKVKYEGKLYETMVRDLEAGHEVVAIPENTITI